MCYFEQTQYLGCGHNIETVTEKCELGERYRTSMHDKIITAIHTEDGQCEKCSPPPTYNPDINGVMSDMPDAAPKDKEDLIDLTNETTEAEKRPPLERRDSKGEDLMDVN
jgi:hypothetical protein